MEPTATVGAFLTMLDTQAGVIAGNVGLAAVAGAGIGLALYGINRVWRAFTSL